MVDSLEALVETTQDPEERLQLFYDLTSEYNNVNPRASIRFADSTIKWARKLGNEKREYQGQYARGAGFYFLGENDSAEKYVRLALDRALVMDIKPDIADSYNLLGAVLKNTGEFLQALESFQKGLLVSRELQDTTLIYTLLINQAEIYLQQGDLELSRNNYEEGLDLILATEGGESFAAAVVYNNLGELDNIPNDTALQFLSQAQDDLKEGLEKTESRDSSAGILIAEDNPDVRTYLRTILEPHYQVMEAGNGQIALELARKELPDLLISDIMMPEMDGYALTRELKGDLRTGHIPVIQLTAKAGRDSMMEGLETQADDYLTKPFDEEELLLRVKNRIEQRRRLSQQLGKDIVRLSPQDVAVKSADKVFLEKVIGVAETYLHDEAFSVEDLGREVGLSRSQLHRKLKALTDQSPSVFLRTLRLKRAHQLLEQNAGTAAEIAYEVGFSSPAYFSKCYKDQYETTPRC